jgi:hypothetical protein
LRRGSEGLAQNTGALHPRLKPGKHCRGRLICAGGRSEYPGCCRR